MAPVIPQRRIDIDSLPDDIAGSVVFYNGTRRFSSKADLLDMLTKYIARKYKRKDKLPKWWLKSVYYDDESFENRIGLIVRTPPWTQRLADIYIDALPADDEIIKKILERFRDTTEWDPSEARRFATDTRAKLTRLGRWNKKFEHVYRAIDRSSGFESLKELDRKLKTAQKAFDDAKAALDEVKGRIKEVKRAMK